jgi:hypothetical protein
VRALREAHVRVLFVTHLSGFARALWQQQRPDTLFLRAERDTEGHRTFRILPGEPLETSFGADLYDEVFGAQPGEPSVARERMDKASPQ